MRRKPNLLSVVALGAATLVELAVSEPAAHAQRVSFNYTGKLVTYTVPRTGSYQIVACGATIRVRGERQSR